MVTTEVAIADLIKRRRLQILVHSYIYYVLDNNIVSDATWSKWAMELVKLQKEYPDVAKTVRFHELFKDFDGSTGFDLAQKADEDIISKAYYLLRIEANRKRKRD